jgi:hypothetical protein
LSKIETIIYNQMKIALLGYGKMGGNERIALERGHEIV